MTDADREPARDPQDLERLLVARRRPEANDVRVMSAYVCEVGRGKRCAVVLGILRRKLRTIDYVLVGEQL